jgi:hypothetical protein
VDRRRRARRARAVAVGAAVVPGDAVAVSNAPAAAARAGCDAAARPDDRARPDHTDAGRARERPPAAMSGASHRAECAATVLAIAATACAGPSLHRQLAERLRAMEPHRDPDAAMRFALEAVEAPRSGSSDVPDAHGTVVAIDSGGLAVRLDEQLPFPPRAVGMAVHANGVYKGELLVREIWRGHALGRFFAVGKVPVQLGDRASCKGP